MYLCVYRRLYISFLRIIKWRVFGIHYETVKPEGETRRLKDVALKSAFNCLTNSFFLRTIL